MTTTHTIDVLTARVSLYDEPTPLEVTLGGHKAIIILTNIPQDMTSQMEDAQNNYKNLSERYSTERANHANTRSEMVELRRSTTPVEDAPRPPIGDDTLREMLAFVKAADFGDINQRAVLVRLVTGWNAVQAKQFVVVNQ